VRSVDGLWGAGSKKAVELITNHNAKALLGFLDGRSAHLVEQVCTKAEIPFISAISPDPTLSRINIPWFFSMMPDSEIQAGAIADHIFRNGSDKSVTVITTDDYDQGFTSRYFLEEVSRRSGRPAIEHPYPSGTEEFNQLLEQLSASDSDAIVFFGTSGELDKLLRNPGFTEQSTPLYTPIMNVESDRFANEGIPIFTLRPEGLDSEKKTAFQDKFFTEYGYRPGSYASYVFDGTHALLEAMKMNGSGNHRLQAALREMETKGLHGVISFDSDGMIQQQPGVVLVGEE
jgi:ABC-type branched-subunit amino acid transport system substrate-binding protein